jgi:hypothetical protein
MRKMVRAGVGAAQIWTGSATLVKILLCRFQEKDEYLMRLEKMINPLLDDDDLTALTYILSEIMEKNVKTMQVVLSITTVFAKSESKL